MGNFKTTFDSKDKMKSEVVFINTVLLIGRIADFIDKHSNSEGAFTLEVERPFEESDGNLKSDCFEIHTWAGIYGQIMDNYHLNDNIAVKGRLSCGSKGPIVFAEKITLIK